MTHDEREELKNAAMDAGLTEDEAESAVDDFEDDFMDMDDDSDEDDMF